MSVGIVTSAVILQIRLTDDKTRFSTDLTRVTRGNIEVTELYTPSNNEGNEHLHFFELRITPHFRDTLLPDMPNIRLHILYTIKTLPRLFGGRL